MRGLIERFYRVLARQYPPLDDRLRMLFMLLLLGLTWHEFIETIPLHLRRCPPELFQAVGMMDLLPVQAKDPAFFAHLTWNARWLLVGVWVVAIMGLGGRLPIILTAAGFTAFWSMAKCCSGTGHVLHLPMYTLIVLAIYTRPGAFSADAWIARRWARYPFRPKPHVDATGIARFIILGVAVYTLFAGGLTKLLHAGLHWMDGETLQIHIDHMRSPKGTFGRWLLDQVLEQRWIAAVLASWTILLEVGSIVAVFWRRSRNFILVNACIFHVGIYFMMLPRYFPQMAVYILPFHWGAVVRRSPQPIRRWLAPPRDPVPTVAPGFGHQARNVAFVTILVSVLAFIWVRQREWYPFTHIPMYSDHLTATTFAGHPVADFDTVEGLQRISRDYGQGRQGWFFTFWLAPRVELRGVATGPDGTLTSTDLTPVFLARLHNWTVWNERIAHAVLTEVGRHPVQDGRLQLDGHHDHLTHCLQGALRVLDSAGALAGWDEVRMIYRLHGHAELILCALPATAPAAAPVFRPTAPAYR